MANGIISYTPEDVAKILQISRFTVYELIKRGDLNAYRIGRKVRVEPSELERYKQNAMRISTVTDSPVCPPVLTRSSVNAASVPNSIPDGLIICGQDILLDVLTRHLEKQLPHLYFLRRFVGSIDGLLAMYRRDANLVTAHLWDSDADEYNIPYVRRLLPGHKALIYNLVYRMEGFYVARGNPKEIKSWSDLTRPEVVFVNRECGSGARVLLDEKLRVFGIEHSAVNGYHHEEMSHLAVASCVARGEADVGLGIEKAAGQVQDIEFIPLVKERYDLIMRKEDASLPHFQAVLSIMNSSVFRNEVSGMGGYDISKMGQLMGEV